MKKFSAFLFFIFYFLYFALPSHASYISLQTSLTSQYENDRLTVNVTIVNKGDESAYNVQVEFRVGGRNVLSSKIAELAVGETRELEQTLPFNIARPGTYPLALITHYTDANQYPFSALLMQTFVYRDSGFPPLSGQLSSASFDREGKLDYKIKNSGQGVVKVQTTLIAPAELTIVPVNRELIIEPGTEQGLSFAVKNFSALPGSTYQIFAVAEFEENGLHYTAIAPGLIKIVARRAILGIDQSIYIAILALLLLLFVGAQLLRKK
jgi:hypothetical protein